MTLNWLMDEILAQFELTTKLPGSFGAQNSRQCLQQDVQVEPELPVPDVEQILSFLDLQIAITSR
jgi:hypothetical protein